MASTLDEVRRAAFRARLEFWIRRTELKPTRVRFRRLNRLWAVCHVDDSITFASALLDQPPPFQDLVIVHELIHLRIRDHSVFFRLALEIFQPEWRTASKLAPESPAH